MRFAGSETGGIYHARNFVIIIGFVIIGIALATIARNRVPKDTWVTGGVAVALGDALRAMSPEGASQEEKRQQSEDIERAISL